MADSHSATADVYSDAISSCLHRPGTITKKAAQKVFIGLMLSQKGNQDIEDPFAAFFCGFQLKLPADLFKEGQRCSQYQEDTISPASDAEEAHLHSVDGRWPC